ncbi:MAG: hypothetical protein ABSC36_01965 [Gaiellaceae bacterium]
MPDQATPSDLWERLAGEGKGESAFWSSLLKPEPEREPELAFSPLAAPELALGIETVYEGYLVHYGCSRLFAPGEPNLALLLGDRLYARGLVLVSGLGDVAVVADLATLLELCARLQAERKQGDGALWAAGISLLGKGGIEREGEAFLSSGDSGSLLRLARESAGLEPVERALAVHASLLS